jgi:chromosome segregation ATPase
VEHHPHNATGGDLPEMQTIEQRLGRVFVSPRVVDQHAFEQFSSTLRDLMREAATHGRTLLSATNDIRSLDVHVKEAGKELQGSLEAASKALPQIDQRLAKAEQVAAIVNKDVATRLEQLKNLAIDQEAITASVRRQMQSIVERVTREETEAFAASITKLMDDRVLHAREACEAAVENARGRLEQMLTTAKERIESLASVHVETERRMDAASEMIDRMDDSRKALEETVIAITTRLEAGANAIDQRVAESTHEAEKLLDTTREQLAAVADRAMELKEQAFDMTALKETLADAMDAIAKGTDVALELRELTARGTHQHESQIAAVGKLDKLLGEATILSTNLSSMVQRGDVIGRGLDTLIREADKRK